MNATATKTETAPATENVKYTYGTGRRKSAVARVRVLKGSGKLLVNGKERAMPSLLQNVLDLVGVKDSDISAHVQGGGVQGQIIAVRHGLARALLEMNPEFRATLKKEGFLTRDSREKERKHYGFKSARRAPQFSKR